MKKKIFYSFLSIILVLLFFLNLESTRYTGINYSISEEKISNFSKINDFYDRHVNYKKLVKKILENSKEKNFAIDLSNWVYLNIKKHEPGINIIDSHPWTIIDRKIGTKDQFSDILSVLLVYKNIDSFYSTNFNKLKYPFTFFKDNGKWTVIDPYYGIYFLNEKNEFCSLKEIKSKKCKIFHLKYKKNIKDKLKDIFKDKNFNNLIEVYKFYNSLLENCLSEDQIENTNIYLRGGRSYIQKPFHRFIYQIQKIFNLI